MCWSSFFAVIVSAAVFFVAGLDLVGALETELATDLPVGVAIAVIFVNHDFVAAALHTVLLVALIAAVAVAELVALVDPVTTCSCCR